MWESRGCQEPRLCVCPYSPKCVEGEFSNLCRIAPVRHLRAHLIFPKGYAWMIICKRYPGGVPWLLERTSCPSLFPVFEQPFAAAGRGNGRGYPTGIAFQAAGGRNRQTDQLPEASPQLS